MNFKFNLPALSATSCKARHQLQTILHYRGLLDVKVVRLEAKRGDRFYFVKKLILISEEQEHMYMRHDDSAVGEL